MRKQGLLLAAMLLLIAGSAPAQDYSWSEVAGLANDIGVGANGMVWIVGSKNRGAPAMHYEDGAWVMAPQRKWHRIAVGPNGAAYAINQQKKIYRWQKSAWQELPGDAEDIGVGADGSVFIIGTASNNHRIMQWVDGSWKDMPGSNFSRVSVSPDGNPYAVTSENKIVRWRNGTWQTLDGAASDIAVGPDGSVYIVGTSADGKSISMQQDGAWVKLPMDQFTNVAVGPDGIAWATQGEGRIYMLRK